MQLKQHRSKDRENRLGELDTPGLWKLYKILRYDRRGTLTIHRVNGLAHKDGPWNAMNEHPDEDMDFLDQVEEVDQDDDHENICYTTPDEIVYIIWTRHKRKAPRKDGITNNALKHLPRKGMVFLTVTITGILKTKYFPDEWEEAETIMLKESVNNEEPTIKS